MQMIAKMMTRKRSTDSSISIVTAQEGISSVSCENGTKPNGEKGLELNKAEASLGFVQGLGLSLYGTCVMP